MQWQVSGDGGANFTDISGATAPTYTTPATSAAENGNQYRAVFTDGQGPASSNAATLTVVQAPTANNQAVATPYNTARAITLTGSDPNSPARTLTYTVTTATSHGTLSGTAPNLTYTPTAYFTGSDSFTFTVNNGTSTSAPATVSITVVAPPAPAAPVVTAPANGSSVTTATPTVTGTTAAETTVAVYVDGGLRGNATVTGTSFSYTPSPALGQGPHTVYAVASNAGGPSPQSATNTFTVDTVPPAAPVIVSPANGSTTSNRQPVVSGTAEANSTVTIAFNSGGSGSVAANASGNWSFTPPSALPVGNRTVTATARDAAGNVSPTATSSFVIAEAPTVSSIAPSGGSTGGGTPVTIAGTNFVNGNTYTVTFGATTVAATYASATTLTATTPAGTGTVQVTVTNTSTGQAGTGSASYTYAVPTVTALNVTSGPASQPRAVTITGTNFTPSATVAIDGQSATSVSYVNVTQLNATLPSRPAGTYSVRVTTGSVTTAANPPADQYTYVAAPTLTSATPNSGTTLGGTSVTITGTNLTAATAVIFGGAAAQSYVVNSATQITAVTPSGQAGTSDVSVTTPGGTATLASAYTYVVLTAPAATTQPADQTVAVGATATFTAAASGSPAPTVQWQVSTNGGGSFTDIAGATASSYTTPATAASDNGNHYRAVFNNSQGTATTNAAALTVIQAPTANSQSVTAPFNTATAITLTGTDPNTPARTLTYSVATAPARGSLTGTAPNLTYSPNANARGADSFTFTVNNGVSTSAPATVSITVSDPVLSITNMPPVGRRGVGYDFQFSTSGGSGSYAYAVTNGNLPAGLTLSSGGRITGAPTASGDFTATVTVTDAGLGNPPVTQSQAFTLVVAAPTLTASPPAGSLPGGTVGIAYSLIFTTNGGTGPYTYALASGSLPGGMVLGADGRFSGTPTQAGGYSFSITATDSSNAGSGGPYTLTTAYSGNIQAPTIAVTPSTIPQPQVGSSYSVNLGASGGTAPYAFAITAGTLPAGLSLNAGGALSGTPTQGGSYNFTVAATDSSTGTGAPFTGTQQYTGTVLAPAIVLSPGAVPAATGGQSYSQSLTASGGTAPYSYAVTAGALPVGITLSPTGTLSGTPTVQGSFTFTVTALDSSTGGPNPGGAYVGSAAYTLSVNAPTIVVAPETLPAGTVAATYSQTLTASGGTGTYTYSIANGTLPAGLALAADGTLAGTPTAGGAFGFTVQAADGNGFTGTRAYTLAIGAPTIALAPASLPDATRNVAYSQTFTASGGTAPYSFVVTAGAVPTGLTLTTAGTLSGTPTTGGTFAFTVTATDASTGTGPYGGSTAYSLTVVVPNIQIVPGAVAQGTTRVAYSQTLTASGGAAPYTYAVTAGVLPSGLALAADGTLSGTTTQAGTFAFTATATDVNGNTGEQAYSLVIDTPAIAIVPTAIPAATAGLAYSQTLTASGGAAPYTYAVTAGALPLGLSLASDGKLSGTPTISGSFAFTVTTTDSNGNTGTQGYTLGVDAPQLAITPASLPNATAGNAYAATFAATGGAAPYRFAVTGGTLPAGLALDVGGSLSGTPQRGGSFTFAVEATDANGFVGVANLSLTVSGEIPVAQSQSATLLAGTTTTVRLTDGARNGPFTNATLVGLSDPSLGEARIVRSGSDYDLVFASNANASGQTVASYTLSNQFATSAPATVTFTVAARPDPSQDAEVTGLMSAQVESTQRMARAQIKNFRDRLEQTHDEETRQQGSFGITLGGGESRDDSPVAAYAEEAARLGSDPATLAILGYANDGKQIALPSETQTRRRFGNAAFWAGGFVNFGSRENDGVALDQTMVGISAGMDYRFSSQFVGGVGFGMGRDKSEVGDADTETSTQAYSGAVYGSYSPFANIFVDGLLGYSHLTFDSQRTVTDQDLEAEGTRSGNQVFGSLTLAYEHKQNGWLVSPYAGYEGSWSRLDSYSEDGAGVFNLRFGEQAITTASALIGLRLEKELVRPWGTLTPKGRVEYSHDFDGSSRVNLGYADLGDDLPFALDADVFSKDNITLGLGLDAQFETGWGLGLDYNTELGTNGNAQDHRIEAKVSKRF
ncbi:MAG: autotransporter domain-containing protein [Methylobacterium mesophilicum]|nr:autotransporter domain-containing protein [Methylobacterium mesophilicum]